MWDLICKIDLDMIKEAGADTIVTITFPKIPGDSKIEINYGKVKTGDEVMYIEEKKKLPDFKI